MQSLMTPAITQALKTGRKLTKPTDVTIKLNREGETAVTLNEAGLGEQIFELESTGSITTSYVSKDFLIDRAAYDFGAGPVEPKERDFITIDDGTNMRTFELLDVLADESWRWQSRFELGYRLSTKHTKTEASPP